LSTASGGPLKTPKILRQDVKLPIRIWGMDASGRPFMEQARTVSAGPLRACIAGLQHEVLAGEILGIGYQDRKARFSVVEVGQSGTPEAGNIEVRPLDLVQDFWKLDFGSPKEQLSQERRGAPRYPCRGSIAFRQQDSSAGSMAASVTDISTSGCYVELLTTLPVGTVVSSLLHVEEFTIRCMAEVRTSHPGVGMGIMFQQMEEADRKTMEQLLARLAAASS
jgi:hypothetical protein